ncbi:MAG: hypothetical protein ABIJ09_14930 [Pseudomonadota bacterium]
MHRWKFFRAGGFDQVRLDTGADLLALDQLDPKLWAALSCPTKGLEIDPKTLEWLDSDHDGRVRVPEVIAAAKWAGSMLKDPDRLCRGDAELPLDSIDDSKPEGQHLRAASRQILRALGKTEAKAISADDTAERVKALADTLFNGDGIVPAAAAGDDDATRQAIQDILDTVGGELDRGGASGVSQVAIDRFFGDAKAYSDWWKLAEDQADGILLLGDESTAAMDALQAVQAKVEDYFMRCELAAFDARAAAPLNRAEAEYVALADQDLSQASASVEVFPLAHVEAGAPLPLGVGVNPAWRARVATFADKVVTPLLGARDSLSRDEWNELRARFAAHRAWLGSKAGASVAKLGIERIRALLDGEARDKIQALVARDKELAPEFDAIADVDKLVRYHRDLHTLLNNFVSFKDFYQPGEKATFQSGTLYLDGRSCDLCVRVEDAGKHSGLATLSRMYLAYCDCTRQGSSDKMTIAVAITAGDDDQILVGRNGVFYDRQGRDWDATIVKLVEHPISIRQAFWSPYKKIAKMVGQQIHKFAAAREKAVQDKAAEKAVVQTLDKKPDEAKPATAPPFDVGRYAGIFAAIGLALGAIATVLASVLSGFFKLTWWQMPLAVIALLLLVSGPSMLIAWLKLRSRNLGPLLDAGGWAVNTHAKINVSFGRSLTSLARLPDGAERSLVDPYADKKQPWALYLLLLILAAAAGYFWYTGDLQGWIGLEGAPVVETPPLPEAPPAP